MYIISAPPHKIFIKNSWYVLKLEDVMIMFPCNANGRTLPYGDPKHKKK